MQKVREIDPQAGQSETQLRLQGRRPDLYTMLTHVMGRAARARPQWPESGGDAVADQAAPGCSRFRYRRLPRPAWCGCWCLSPSWYWRTPAAGRRDAATHQQAIAL
jgi:hypothetical protein